MNRPCRHSAIVLVLLILLSPCVSWAQTKRSLPVWTPDASLAKRLGEESTVQGWSFRPPRGFDSRVVQGEVEDHYEWKKAREGTLEVGIAHRSPGPISLEEAMTRGFDGMTSRSPIQDSSPAERGMINGLQWIRKRFTAKRFSGRSDDTTLMYGFAYLTLDADTPVFLLGIGDRPTADLLEASVLTMRLTKPRTPAVAVVPSTDDKSLPEWKPTEAALKKLAAVAKFDDWSIRPPRDKQVKVAKDDGKTSYTWGDMTRSGGMGVLVWSKPRGSETLEEAIEGGFRGLKSQIPGLKHGPLEKGRINGRTFLRTRLRTESLLEPRKNVHGFIYITFDTTTPVLILATGNRLTVDALEPSVLTFKSTAPIPTATVATADALPRARKADVAWSPDATQLPFLDKTSTYERWSIRPPHGYPFKLVVDREKKEVSHTWDDPQNGWLVVSHSEEPIGVLRAAIQRGQTIDFDKALNLALTGGVELLKSRLPNLRNGPYETGRIHGQTFIRARFTAKNTVGNPEIESGFIYVGFDKELLLFAVTGMGNQTTVKALEASALTLALPK